MIDLAIEGTEELGAAINKIGAKIRAEFGREAIVTAGTPMVNSAKRHARKDTGTLEESIGMRVKARKRNSGFFSAIGPRRGFKGPDGRDPSKYGRFVENGHKTKSGVVAINPFVRPGWQETKGEMIPTMGRVMGARVLAYAARVKSKPRKK